jgi:hypothetical protein
MSNLPPYASHAEDRKHELFVFLGGDDFALKVSRALRYQDDIPSVEDLKRVWADPRLGAGYLIDIRLIGTKAIERIKEKIEGPAAPVMDVPTASLIIRMELALRDEGIGPKVLWDGDTSEAQPIDTTQSDRAVLDQAVKVAGHLFNEYELQDAGLM